MKKQKLFLILFPLCLGISIYVIYRSQNLFYFKIIHSHSFFSNPILYIRELAWKYRKVFPLWVVYSLPDGLWLFSLGATLLIDRIFFYFHFFLFTGIYVFMIFFEFVQKIFGGHGTIIGTYDPFDILFFTLAYISISLIGKNLHNRICIHPIKINRQNKKIELVSDIKIIIFFAILALLPILI